MVRHTIRLWISYPYVALDHQISVTCPLAYDREELLCFSLEYNDVLMIASLERGEEALSLPVKYQVRGLSSVF